MGAVREDIAGKGDASCRGPARGLCGGGGWGVASTTGVLLRTFKLIGHFFLNSGEKRSTMERVGSSLCRGRGDGKGTRNLKNYVWERPVAGQKSGDEGGSLRDE